MKQKMTMMRLGISGSLLTVFMQPTLTSLAVSNDEIALKITNNPQIELELDALDDLSQVASKRFQLEGHEWTSWMNYSEKDLIYPTNILTDGGVEGLNLYHAQVKDNAGNVSSEQTRGVVLDQTGPILTELEVKPLCTNQPVIRVQATAEDNFEGLYTHSKTIQLSNNGNSWTPHLLTNQQLDADWTVPLINGTRTLYARGIDNLGNVGAVRTVNYQIDTVAPTGTIQIDGGRVYVPSTSTVLEIMIEDDHCGIERIRVFDDYGDGEYWFELSEVSQIKEGVEFSIPWELATRINEEGYEVGRVGLEIIDHAGNVTTLFSQEVIVSKISATCLTITDIVNPAFWDSNHPYEPMQYCNQAGGARNTLIPSPMVAGGSFSFQAEYIYPFFTTPFWSMNYRAEVKLTKEDDSSYQTWIHSIESLQEAVDGSWENLYRIPYAEEDSRIEDGLSIYLNIGLRLYDNLGRLCGYDYIPRPENTFVKIGTIEGDIREALQFNEIN